MNFITILFARITTFILNLLGRGGSLPGQLALKMNTNILKNIKFDGLVVVVTGTNGKTSTANLIDDMLAKKYKTVISNRRGDNMSYGIATTILSNTSLLAKVKADAIVLEVDELNMPFVMNNVEVSHVVVTNFFRDQLDRAQEMSRIVQAVSSSLDNFSGTLVLNGHDANVMSLTINSKATISSFGVENIQTSNHVASEASDGKFCPKCNSELNYSFHQYSHIGEFHCPNCDFETPETMLLAKVMKDETFEVESENYNSSSLGLYSIYNCMAVICLAKVLNLDTTLAKEAFLEATRPIGRNELFHLKHGNLVLNLIKNPTGANEVLKLIEASNKELDIIIVCNDNAQDGKDVSWLYDTHFEKLNRKNIKMIYCSGLRAYDMALRLKYAGVNTKHIQVIQEIEQAVSILDKTNNDVFALTTYTALVPTRKQIERYKK